MGGRIDSQVFAEGQLDAASPLSPQFESECERQQPPRDSVAQREGGQPDPLRRGEHHRHGSHESGQSASSGISVQSEGSESAREQSTHGAGEGEGESGGWCRQTGGESTDDEPEGVESDDGDGVADSEPCDDHEPPQETIGVGKEELRRRRRRRRRCEEKRWLSEIGDRSGARKKGAGRKSKELECQNVEVWNG